MDSTRFDRLTISLSARLSRRRALATGAAGLSAFALSGSSLPALAQNATPACEGNCTTNTCGPLWC